MDWRRTTKLLSLALLLLLGGSFCRAATTDNEEGKWCSYEPWEMRGEQEVGGSWDALDEHFSWWSDVPLACIPGLSTLEPTSPIDSGLPLFTVRRRPLSTRNLDGICFRPETVRWPLQRLSRCWL